MKNSLPFQIALTLIPKLGPVKAKKLLNKFNIHEVFKAPVEELLKVAGITPTIADNIQQFNNWKIVEDELNFIERNQINTHFIGENSYPHRLVHCPDAPLLLFTKGIATLNAKRMIAIVGTSFLMAVAMLAILAVVAGQKLGVLSGVTPMHFALGMMAVGALGFAFRILDWRMTRQPNDDQ